MPSSRRLLMLLHSKRAALLLALGVLTALSALPMLGSPADARSQSIHAQSAQNVLLLGNSYTNGVHHAGRLDGFFNHDDDNDAALTFRHPGGWWLENHAAYVTSTQLITDTDQYSWDVVLLQDQSLGPALASRNDNLGSLDPGGPHLIGLIAEHHPQARVVLFNTWPRQKDNDQLVGHFDNDPQLMQQHIGRGYRYIADAAPDITSMALVGDAFLTAIEARPHLELYATDGSHASTAGSYLAAAVIYQTITGKSPVGNAHRAGLGDQDALFLQDIAASVAQQATQTPSPSPTRTVTPTVAPTATPTTTPEPSMQIFLPVALRKDSAVSLRLSLDSQVGGAAGGIVADGRRAWAGIGPRVVAFEIGSDDRLQLIGASDVMPGLVRDIALGDDHVYALVEGGPRFAGSGPDQGVYVFDVASGLDPVHVGTSAGIGVDLHSTIVSSPSAVFVTGFNTVWALDITDPSRPSVVSHVDMQSVGDPELWGAAWRDGYLYLLHFDFHYPDYCSTAVVVLDVARPGEMTHVHSAPLSSCGSRAWGQLHIDGERLYWLTDDPAVMSLADPGHPVEIPDALPIAEGATVAGSTMFVVTDGAEAAGVLALDVTDPMSFTISGGGTLGVDASRLTVSDGFLYGNGQGVGAVDVSDVEKLAAAGACPMPAHWVRDIAFGAAGLFAPEGQRVWHWPHPTDVDVACPNWFREGIDWSHLGPMVLTGQRGFGAEVAREPAGVWGVDLSDPGTPRIAGRSADLPFLEDIAAEGDHVFALSQRGLHIIDGTDVDAPLLIQSIELYDRTYWDTASLDVRDGLLIAVGRALRLFDVSDPTSPVALGSLEASSGEDVVLHGRLAFVSGTIAGDCTGGGLYVLDVDDPTAPHMVASICDLNVGPIAVAKPPSSVSEGSILFAGFTQFSMSPPSIVAYYVPPSGRVPVPIAKAYLPGEPADLAISDDGGRLWVAVKSGGVLGFDVRGGGQR